MSTNIQQVSFEDGKQIVVRSRQNGSLYDFYTLDIEFLPEGVKFLYENDVESTAIVFVPFTAIEQVFQVQ